MSEEKMICEICKQEIKEKEEYITHTYGKEEKWVKEYYHNRCVEEKKP